MGILGRSKKKKKKERSSDWCCGDPVGVTGFHLFDWFNAESPLLRPGSQLCEGEGCVFASALSPLE